MPSYIINEPAPSTTGYTHSGRGGWGNTYRAESSSDSLKPTTSRQVTAPSARQPSGRFFSGVGGAGNVHAASERKAPSFEEDIDRARAREATKAVHVGVGGAGNIYRKDSGSSSVADESESSRRLSADSFWGRLSSGSYSRQHN